MTFSSFQDRSYPGASVPRGTNEATPAGGLPYFRDPLDFARSAFGRRTPEGQYPSGYLGELGNRRQRTLDDLHAKQPRKPTDRGVHRDHKLQADDYIWPEEFHPLSQLGNTERFVSPAMVMEAGLAPPQSDPDRRAELLRMAPGWSSGGPAGMAIPSPAYQS